MTLLQNHFLQIWYCSSLISRQVFFISYCLLIFFTEISVFYESCCHFSYLYNVKCLALIHSSILSVHISSVLLKQGIYHCWRRAGSSLSSINTVSLGHQRIFCDKWETSLSEPFQRQPQTSRCQIP